MSADKTGIEQTVQVYFDSMYESDPEKVNQSFHPSAMITGSFDGNFSEMSREDFGKFVASQQPSPKEKGNKCKTVRPYSSNLPPMLVDSVYSSEFLV